MSKLLKVFIAGTVISLITVPFLFAQDLKLNYLNGNQTGYDLYFKLSEPSSNFNPAVQFSLPDSTLGTDSAFTVKKEPVKKYKMKKQPWKAVLFSALIPGGGQFYNRSYWKVPVLLGLTGYFAYEWVKQNNSYKDYRDQYAASQIISPPEGYDYLKSLREFYRGQRNDFTWYFLIVYFVNLVDAYVDAHLFDFDVRDEKISSMGVVDRKFKLSLHVPIR